MVTAISKKHATLLKQVETEAEQLYKDFFTIVLTLKVQFRKSGDFKKHFREARPGPPNLLKSGLNELYLQKNYYHFHD